MSKVVTFLDEGDFREVEFDGNKFVEKKIQEIVTRIDRFKQEEGDEKIINKQLQAAVREGLLRYDKERDEYYPTDY